MTEPSSQRPVPGPPRPAPPASGPSPSSPSTSGQSPTPSSPGSPAVPSEQPGPADDRFAGLEQRPVAEHVAVFEDEHGRLQRELGTIDQL